MRLMIKGQSMTTKEAIQATLDGKKVRVIDWLKTEYIELSPCGNYTDEDNEYYQISINHKEWEIYEEPKPKQTVIIEKWLCKSAWENYFIIEGEVEFFKTGGYDKQKVKLLDTYEVEL